MTAADLIRRLGLTPHPREGGYFVETYRSADQVEVAGRRRSASTCIYYLLTPTTFSALHRLVHDEVFHFYAGDPVEMLQLGPDGQGRTIVIGSNLLAGHQPQVVVPHGGWPGAPLQPGGQFALLGCTVAPGFDYADYEHGERQSLIAQFPAWADAIVRLTQEPEGPT